MGSEIGRRVWNSAPPPQRPFRVCDHKRTVRKGLTAATRQELLDKVSGRVPGVGKPRDSSQGRWDGRAERVHITQLPSLGKQSVRRGRELGSEVIMAFVCFLALGIKTLDKGSATGLGSQPFVSMKSQFQILTLLLPSCQALGSQSKPVFCLSFY